MAAKKPRIDLSSATLPTAIGSCTGPDQCAEAMKVLSEATRLRIIRALIVGPQNVSAIGEATGLDQPRVSHHLAKMRAAGLLVRERHGRNLVYRINPAILAGSSLDFGCCQISFRRL